MLTLDPNSPYTLDQQLHMYTGTTIKRSDDPSENTFCAALAEICRKDPRFHFTSSEQKAIYQKLLEIKRTSPPSQPKNIEQNTVLLTHLVLIVSQCEASTCRDQLLTYAKERIVLQDFDSTSVCNMLYCLARLPNSIETQAILEHLLSSLVKNRENRQVMAPDDISTAFNGLEWANFPDKTNQRIVDELAWHIEQNTKGGQWFYADELAQCFFRLRKVSFSETTEKALQAFLPHVQHLTQTGEWLYDSQLAEMMEGMQHIPLTQTKQDIITHITTHLSNTTIESNCFGKIIGSLSNISANEIVEPLLNAVFPHIPVDASEEYPLSIADIKKILPGLQHAADLTIAYEILNKLTANLHFPLINEPTEEKSREWLRHARTHLSPYLDPSASDEAQSAARAFLQRAIEIFKPVITIDLDTLHEDTMTRQTSSTELDTSSSEEEVHQVIPASYSVHSNSSNNIGIGIPATSTPTQIKAK